MTDNRTKPEQWAQETLFKVRRALEGYCEGHPATEAALTIQRAFEDRERKLREENAKLQDDIVKLASEEVVAYCEGCNAGLLSSDDYVSSDDCSGCWATMSDLPSKRERPCYAYRVGKLDARQALKETPDAQ